MEGWFCIVIGLIITGFGGYSLMLTTSQMGASVLIACGLTFIVCGGLILWCTRKTGI